MQVTSGKSFKRCVGLTYINVFMHLHTYTLWKNQGKNFSGRGTRLNEGKVWKLFGKYGKPSLVLA